MNTPDGIPEIRALLDLGIWQDVERHQKNPKSVDALYYVMELSHCLFLTPNPRRFADADLPAKARNTLKQLSEIAFQIIRRDEVNIPLLKLLLDAGVDINGYADDDRQNTLLTWAISQCNLDAVNFLLDMGADIELTAGNAQISALYLMSDYRTFDPTHTKPIEQREAIEHLMARGADINSPGHTKEGQRPRYPRYPLTVPCGRGDFELLKWMIEKGADIKAVPDLVITATSAQKNQKEMTQFLIGLGADPCLYEKNSSLISAIEYREIGVARYLLRLLHETSGRVHTAHELLNALIHRNLYDGHEVKLFLDEIECRYPDMWTSKLPDGTHFLEPLLAICDEKGAHGKDWRCFLEHMALTLSTETASAQASMRRL